MRIRWQDPFIVTGLRFAAALTAPLFLFVARTRRGRLIGATAWSLILPPFWILLALGVVSLAPPPGGSLLSPPTPAGVIAAAAFAGWWFSILAAVVMCPFLVLNPPVYQSNAAGVSSLFLGPTWLHRWQMMLPPEEDAIWLGAWLVSRLDPRMSRAEARQLRDGVRGLLDDMTESPEYHALAPALGLTIWGSTLRPDHGHFFAYVPDQDADERLGLIVALHGHGGNAKLWLHVWRAFADEHRVAVVCPSFGYGNWEHPDSPSAVERCLDFALGHSPIDPARVYLAGISQGGCGVGRSAAAMPDRFAGLVFLSPTMEPTVLTATAFVEGWKGRPVFVAQGGRDHNVKPRSVTKAVETLRANGVAVTYHLDPDADHFLFFARLDEMHARIADWMQVSDRSRNHP